MLMLSLEFPRHNSLKSWRLGEPILNSIRCKIAIDLYITSTSAAPSFATAYWAIVNPATGFLVNQSFNLLNRGGTSFAVHINTGWVVSTKAHSVPHNGHAVRYR